MTINSSIHITDKRSNNVYAVITGDLVNSRLYNKNDYGIIIDRLKELFIQLNNIYPNGMVNFEIYRGDSFQGVVLQPELSLKIAIILRALFKSIEPTSKKNIKNKGSSGFCDVRIAIGIGKIEHISERLGETQGQAFELSGLLLEDMKASNQRLAIKTIYQDINDELDTSTKLADVIISKWSTKTSEPVLYSLLEGESQITIANKLSISQPAVHERLKNSNYDQIIPYIKRFELLIKGATDGNST